MHSQSILANQITSRKIESEPCRFLPVPIYETEASSRKMKRDGFPTSTLHYNLQTGLDDLLEIERVCI